MPINLTQIGESKKAGADSLTPYKGCSASVLLTAVTRHLYVRPSSSIVYILTNKPFGKVYTKPIIARLNAEARSFNFTQDDITSMSELCGYETLIRGSSSFCSPKLFNSDEWLGFEYANDPFKRMGDFESAAYLIPLVIFTFLAINAGLRLSEGMDTSRAPQASLQL